MRTLLMTLALLVALPGTMAAQSPANSPATSPAPLEEAVAFLPYDAHELGFTDWSRIRASLGMDDVTGASPIDDKMAVLMATNRQEAAASAFGAAYLQHHRDAWGWDTLDVDWEAAFSGDGPPVSVVRLRQGTDMAAIAAHYDDYGFATEEVPGATIRSTRLDPGAEWMGTTDLGVINTAFLDDGRTLVLSSSPDVLRATLGQVDQMPLPGQPGVVRALAGASAAWLVLTPDCTAFTPLPFDPFDPDSSIRPLATGQPLHPWTTLGIGYARPGWDPVGRIAMGFLAPDQAQADAEARTAEARDGISVRTHQPYSDAVFTLVDSHVDGRTLVLDVNPVDDLTPRLFQMPLARDMTFAGC